MSQMFHTTKELHKAEDVYTTQEYLTASFKWLKGLKSLKLKTLKELYGQLAPQSINKKAAIKSKKIWTAGRLSIQKLGLSN